MTVPKSHPPALVCCWSSNSSSMWIGHTSGLLNRQTAAYKTKSEPPSESKLSGEFCLDGMYGNCTTYWCGFEDCTSFAFVDILEGAFSHLQPSKARIYQFIIALLLTGLLDLSIDVQRAGTERQYARKSEESTDHCHGSCPYPWPGTLPSPTIELY